MKFNKTPPVGNANFLKLRDGESVTGVFRGDPREMYVRWASGKSTEVDEEAPGASFRFRINFVVSENGVMVAKIWEQGPTVYNALKELAETYDLEETLVKIKRTGSSMNDTSYSVLPLPPTKQVSKAKLESTLKNVKLQDLTGKKDAPEFAPFPTSEDEPFDDGVPF